MIDPADISPEDGNATEDAPESAGPAPRRFEDLPPAAQRALREAEARRAAIDASADTLPAEIDGRGGKEPVRYGDWEVKGLAIDF